VTRVRYRVRKLPGVNCQALRTSPGAFPVKTNCLAYPYVNRAFSSNSWKRTDWVKPMSRHGLILEILNSFIRRPQQCLRLSARCCVDETNWMSHLTDNVALSRFLGKRTGWPKLLILKGMILRILRPFMPCHQQCLRLPARSRVYQTNWMSHLTDNVALSRFLAKRTGWPKLLIPKGMILKILKPFIPWRPAAINELAAPRNRREEARNVMRVSDWQDKAVDLLKTRDLVIVALIPSMNRGRATHLSTGGCLRTKNQVRRGGPALCISPAFRLLV
jgi:hypothetical protein